VEAEGEMNEKGVHCSAAQSRLPLAGEPSGELREPTSALATVMVIMLQLLIVAGRFGLPTAIVGMRSDSLGL
jgi:hypothetical protein